MIINEDVLNARQEFYTVLGCIVNAVFYQELDADFEEVEVEKGGLKSRWGLKWKWGARIEVGTRMYKTKGTFSR